MKKPKKVTAPKKVIAKQSEPTITVGDKDYNVSDLSADAKELLMIHEAASRALTKAKREAAINEIALANLANLIDKELSKN